MLNLSYDHELIAGNPKEEIAELFCSWAAKEMIGTGVDSVIFSTDCAALGRGVVGIVTVLLQSDLHVGYRCQLYNADPCCFDFARAHIDSHI